LTIPIGLWLAFSAIFATPAGSAGNLSLGLSGAAIAVLAVLAGRMGAMAWQARTNIVLGVILLIYAGVRQYVGGFGVDSFWVDLLGGIAAAIGALWSILYRPDQGEASPA
jgi:hypothetical protein